MKSPAATPYQRPADILRPSPAEALTCFDERVDTINDGSFAMQRPFKNDEPSGWTLRDKPAVVHDGAATLTFASGHVETHRWEDARTPCWLRRLWG